ECKGNNTATSDSGRIRHIFECAFLLVVEQQNAVVSGNRQIRKSIIVVVACCATRSVILWIDPSLFSHILKRSITEIVQQRHSTWRAVDSKKNINPSIAGVGEKTSARAECPLR